MLTTFIPLVVASIVQMALGALWYVHRMRPDACTCAEKHATATCPPQVWLHCAQGVQQACAPWEPHPHRRVREQPRPHRCRTHPPPVGSPHRRYSDGVTYGLAMAGNVLNAVVFWRLVLFWGASSFYDVAVLAAFCLALHAGMYIPHPLFDGQGLQVAVIHLGYDVVRAIALAVVFWGFQVGVSAPGA